MNPAAYPLAPFRSEDLGKIHAVVRAFPLATIVSRGDEWPVVTQVPLLLDDSGTVLSGHFDGNNPHGALMRRDPRVTCLFHGPNDYVTPTIYPTEQYPGWNYVTVHVRALARPMDDRDRARALLLRLAERFEPQDSGYTLRPTQKNFETYLGMIFGFDLQILEARAVFKLAQDKPAGHADLAAVHLARAARERDHLPLLRALLTPEGGER